MPLTTQRGDPMTKHKGKIQFLLNEYLETHGSIDIRLPDGVEVEIGITQEGKKGPERLGDYCWIVTSRGGRQTTLDRYGMSMQFEDENCRILDDNGNVTII
jgi:hypothetical protein